MKGDWGGGDLERLVEEARKLPPMTEEARKLPPMTEEELREQSLDFVYGNLACSTNHKPTREAFASLAKELGWTDERFEDWAAEREWWTR